MAIIRPCELFLWLFQPSWILKYQSSMVFWSSRKVCIHCKSFSSVPERLCTADCDLCILNYFTHPFLIVFTRAKQRSKRVSYGANEISAVGTSTARFSILIWVTEQALESYFVGSICIASNSLAVLLPLSRVPGWERRGVGHWPCVGAHRHVEYM